MTLEDAKKLCPIIAQIDGGCITCVSAFISELNEAFPDFVWEAVDWYTEKERVTVRKAV